MFRPQQESRSPTQKADPSAASQHQPEHKPNTEHNPARVQRHASRTPTPKSDHSDHRTPPPPPTPHTRAHRIQSRTSTTQWAADQIQLRPRPLYGAMSLCRKRCRLVADPLGVSAVGVAGSDGVPPTPPRRRKAMSDPEAMSTRKRSPKAKRARRARLEPRNSPTEDRLCTRRAEIDADDDAARATAMDHQTDDGEDTTTGDAVDKDAYHDHATGARARTHQRERRRR